VRITDRKKDLVKTSGGKYIAPSAIESRLKASSPIIGHVVVHADKRNFASALITLDPDVAPQWAEGEGITGDYRSLTSDPRVRAHLQQCVDELNVSLNRWETLKQFRVLDHDFTVETGELTPSQKVKRRVVENMYSEVLDEMYAGS
jgi:long-chain acyl-CoA synthetase